MNTKRPNTAALLSARPANAPAQPQQARTVQPPASIPADTPEVQTARPPVVQTTRPVASRPGQRRTAPDKDAIAQMPVFDRLGLEQITLVATAGQAVQAQKTLMTESVWGFDTESKPTFFKDQTSDGPHIVQLALSKHAWIFQLHDPECLHIVAQLLAAPGIHKVGFGLREDRKHLIRKFGTEGQGLLDLNHEYAKKGYRRELGVRDAIALTYGRRFIKSKKISTSNWANQMLSDAQLIYAANDAWAALKAYQALQ